MRRLAGWLWQQEFLWRLSKHSGIRFSRRMLQTEISRMVRGDMPGTDDAKLFNLRMAQSLYAAVRLLEREAGLNRPIAHDLARAAFVKSGSWLARGLTRLWLRLERDPYAEIKQRGAAALTRRLWGNGMEAEDRLSPGQISLCVTSYPFHAYFWNVGRSDLTPILCEWDTAWQQEVNASPKAVYVEIARTLGRGDNLCEFAFSREARSE